MKLPSGYGYQRAFWMKNIIEFKQRFIKKLMKQIHLQSLMSDGWTDIKGNPLLNLVFDTPEPVFLKAIESKTTSHTAQYMAEVIDTHAACLLDPKQKGSALTEEERSVAIQTISDIAETITDVDAGVVLGNLAEHKAWSSKAIWNAANNTSRVTQGVV
ncbi:hypothetical protein PR048_022476 [Dryococelus australis]|uniref:DUF659 domain-containing protein n=1 Tax=Dryococelus australis TaxID=614101 RepID=A0ABQ9H148_9NEOP|nr:hypothetical protein PR048_022476 [Dryococelus australis]